VELKDKEKKTIIMKSLITLINLILDKKFFVQIECKPYNDVLDIIHNVSTFLLDEQLYGSQLI